MRKQLDPRIQTLIRTNVATHHRSFFVLVGDRARDQVINLHLLLSQARHTARPTVLWCYKKDLGFTTHRKKREAKVKRDIKRGIREKGDSQDPFELFVGTTEIRYCYYKDTPKILGRTFGMLILQDFEAMTPNMLARTIETVEGGGIVVLMLRTMSSLRQLYSVGMDVHSKYRSTMDTSEPVARFNERFLLSLGANSDTLFLDDELNVLPLSRGKDINAGQDLPSVSNADTLALDQLKEEAGGNNAGVTELVKSCKTLDQAKSLLNILDILSSSSLSSTVSLTAARGRGKSALLGLAMAAAIAHGYSNIFVTSPSPENLKTLFEFLFKGLAVLGYEEVSDWSLQRGTGEWKDVVVRVNVFRNSRQTIQYIDPADSHVLGQAELVVIDEAAAIPLPLVRKLVGPYLVFLSSTVNGYEGTGRSLSLKLIQQLRDSANGGGNAIKAAHGNDEEDLTVASTSKSGLNSFDRTGSSAATLRTLEELTLNEPIRYSRGDQIELWLNQLLCLDASLASTSSKKSPTSPHPSKCDLYLVNRDALFSYHPASELFLQKMMALYVSSHYKNSPNDLQLMSDAPSHRLFVLLGPAKEGSGELPEPLAVLQVSLEGNIARQSVLSSLSRGERSSGDLIPWTLSQQFQDFDFASLNGVRVVRLAVNPQYAQSGYGSRAMECLRSYFAGDMADEDAIAQREAKAISNGEESFSAIVSRTSNLAAAGGEPGGLQNETIALRDASRMPALLQRLSDRRPEQIDWLGVSFGLTPALFRFWKKNGYTPLYIRQTANDLTGEYTTVMLRGTTADMGEDLSWLGEFAKDFRRRFNNLLSFRFRDFAASSALSILEAVTAGIRLSSNGASGGSDGNGSGNADGNQGSSDILTASEIHHLLSPFDLKRLEAFGNNMLDYSVVLDLFPALASLYFAGRIRSSDEDGHLSAESGGLPSQPEEDLAILKLSALQAALLLSIGLQRKDPSEVTSTEFGLPVQQGVALLAKGVRRILLCLRRVQRREVGRGVIAEEGQVRVLNGQPHSAKLGRRIDKTIEEELQEAGRLEAGKRRAETAMAEQQHQQQRIDEPMLVDVQDPDNSFEGSSDDEIGEAPLPSTSSTPAPLDAADLSSFDISSSGPSTGSWEEAEARVRALQRAKEEGRSEEEIKRLSTIVSVRKGGVDQGDGKEQREGRSQGEKGGKKRKGGGASAGGDGGSKKRTSTKGRR